MRTTLNLDDALIARARKSTGVQEKTRLLHLGLEALIQREAARQAGPRDASGSRGKLGLLPVSGARGGLVKGLASLEDAIAAANLQDDRRRGR